MRAGGPNRASNDQMTQTPIPAAADAAPTLAHAGPPSGDPRADPTGSGAAAGAGGKKDKKEESLLVFLLKLAAIVFVFRSFIYAPFNIPSESMLPRLETGDYLLAAKWPYGYSNHSLPFGIELLPGRIFASAPERGDVVIFKAPPGNDVDYIKRVIGLPGDTVQMRGGNLYLNGERVPRRRIADFVLPLSPNTACAAPRFRRTVPLAGGEAVEVCRYPRYVETLPGGVSYQVLDIGRVPQDDTSPVIVAEGTMFLMGDNRDNSLDSRFPAVEGGGIGLVPQDNLVGKAHIVMFSTDGSAEWLKPWTWFTATRWGRIGRTF